MESTYRVKAGDTLYLGVLHADGELTFFCNGSRVGSGRLAEHGCITGRARELPSWPEWVFARFENEIARDDANGE